MASNSPFTPLSIFLLCKDTSVQLCQCLHYCWLLPTPVHGATCRDTCLHFVIVRQWRTKSELILSAGLQVCFISETNEDLFQENFGGIKFLICTLFRLVEEWRCCLNYSYLMHYMERPESRSGCFTPAERGPIAFKVGRWVSRKIKQFSPLRKAI
jgi:hypothetical protein